MTMHISFEPIQYTRETYENVHFDMGSESMAEEHEDEDEDESEGEDIQTGKRLRTRGLFVSSNGFSTWAHKVQAPTSEYTVGKQTAGASSVSDCFIDQEPRATDASHGPRVPGLSLTTLLPQRLQKDLVIVELPLELDASHMNAVYTMISVPVPDSMNFKARYSSLLRYFKKAQVMQEQKTKPIIFILTSITNCTVKIITLAEKLKRDLEFYAIECFQYCAVQPRNVSLDNFNNAKRNRKEKAANQDATADSVASVATGSVEQDSYKMDEEEAFQTMTVAHEDSPTAVASGDRKLRRLPVMTIFLALISIPELRHLYWSDSLITYSINAIELSLCPGNKSSDFSELSSASCIFGISGG